MAQNIGSEIKELGSLDLEGLRSRWKELFDQNPPAFRSPDIFRRMLAARIQERAFGGLAPDLKTRLRKLAKAFERNRGPFPSSLTLKTGSVLAREWKGAIHKVRVLRNGFEYEGARFNSLSEVARKITGTRWSGPLFFGLKK
jgi:hypothetical protein